MRIEIQGVLWSRHVTGRLEEALSPYPRILDPCPGFSYDKPVTRKASPEPQAGDFALLEKKRFLSVVFDIRIDEWAR